MSPYDPSHRAQVDQLLKEVRDAKASIGGDPERLLEQASGLAAGLGAPWVERVTYHRACLRMRTARSVDELDEVLAELDLAERCDALAPWASLYAYAVAHRLAILGQDPDDRTARRRRRAIEQVQATLQPGRDSRDDEARIQHDVFNALELAFVIAGADLSELAGIGVRDETLGWLVVSTDRAWRDVRLTCELASAELDACLERVPTALGVRELRNGGWKVFRNKHWQRVSRHTPSLRLLALALRGDLAELDDPSARDRRRQEKARLREVLGVDVFERRAWTLRGDVQIFAAIKARAPRRR